MVFYFRVLQTLSTLTLFYLMRFFMQNQNQFSTKQNNIISTALVLGYFLGCLDTIWQRKP